MNFKPYHLLVQLIPGSLFLGIVLLNELQSKEMGALGWISSTVVAFIIGYAFNGIAHFFEGMWRKPLETRIQKTLIKESEGGWFIKCFRKYSVPTFDEFLGELSTDVNYSPKPYNSSSRNWSKEEKKFARTLFFVCIASLVYVLLCKGCITDHLRNYLSLFLALTIIVSFYRYVVSSIDYAYKHKNKLNEE